MFLYSYLLCSESGFCQAINNTFTKKWKLFFWIHVLVVGVLNEIEVKKIKYNLIRLSHTLVHVAAIFCYLFRIILSLSNHWSPSAKFTLVVFNSYPIGIILYDKQLEIKYNKEEAHRSYIHHTIAMVCHARSVFGVLNVEK